jgi:hypothetical protein
VKKVSVHGDCPSFRGKVRENGTVPLESPVNIYIKNVSGGLMTKLPEYNVEYIRTFDCDAYFDGILTERGG